MNLVATMAAMPPVMWTVPEPAKSMTPQPPMRRPADASSASSLWGRLESERQAEKRPAPHIMWTTGG